MNILLVQGSAERAGAERMLYYLLRFMDRETFNPTVLFLADGPFVEEARALGVEILLRPVDMRLRQLSSWKSVVDTIRTAIRDTSSQVVHANGEKMSILAARAAKSEGVPSIGWLHDAPSAGGLSGRLAQRALAWSRPTQVVTCAKWLADAFNSRLRLDAISVVNGMDLGSLPTGSTAMDELKAEQGWDEGTTVVSHFARLQRWKGHEVFLRAAALLSAELPDLRFLIVGDTMYGREAGYGDELRALAVQLGLEKEVVFTGFRLDALDLMSGSDVVVHCSIKKDPFPTVILEAMGMSRPVVATKTGGPEEALRDNATGLLVEPGDPGGLARGIRKLVMDPQLREALGTAAKEDAWVRFSGRRMSAEFEDLYRTLVTDKLADQGSVK